MTNSLLDSIKEERIPSTLRAQLKLIRHSLQEGRAAAMIGAGFSKNAEMDENVSMKDWQKLGEVFYKTIYDTEPIPGDLRLANPIRLASQVEAIFNRNVLNNLIKTSLPDDKITPGDLHEKLLKLNWTDIFTTNYDTLLERAADNISRCYHKVTSTKALLYEKSPRIIKLHGSFPDKTPFIITEEDYRRYPETHRAFVNTVRQSLIENVFCLIGFSSEDPNFLQWIGWLRDLWQGETTPAFWITYIEPDKVNQADIKLLEKRGIATINLSEIPEIKGFNDALFFFFEYINKKEKNSEWDSKESYINNYLEYQLETENEIEKTIGKMREIRKSYPGWIILPEFNFYNRFEDVSQEFPFLENKIVKLTQKQRIDFLYELDWRLSITNTPKIIDWYIENLEWVSTFDDLEDEQKKEQEFLLISLLNIYRINEENTKFIDLYNKLKEKPLIENTNIRKLYYEGGIFALTRFNYDLLFKILTEWQPSKSDYLGNIWKSYLLLESDRTDEALKLVQATGEQIRKVTISMSESTPFIDSCISALHNLERWTQNQFPSQITINEPESFNQYDILRNFEIEYNKEENVELYHEIHKFGINNTSSEWKSGARGFYNKYLQAYRLAGCKEMLGSPWGVSWVYLDSSWIKVICNALGKEHPGYVFDILLRSWNASIIESCVNRDLISTISSSLANKLFDKYYLALENKTLVDQLLQNQKRKHKIDLVLIILFRLCVKVDQERILKLLKKIVDLVNHDYNVQNKHLRILYDCIDYPRRKEVNSLVSSLKDNKNFLVPYFLKDNKKQEIVVIDQVLVDKVLTTEYCYDGASISIDNLRSDLYLLQPFAKQIEYSEKIKIIEKVINFLRNNEEKFKHNKRSEFFGGISYSLDPLINVFNRLLINFEFTKFEKYDFKEHIELLRRYNQYGFYTILTQTLLCINHYNKSCSKIVKDEIDKAIASTDRYYSKDAMYAIYYLIKRGFSVQAQITRIINYVDFTLSATCTNHIWLISVLVQERLLKGNPLKNINSFLESMYYKLENPGDDEDKRADIQYAILKLAGSLSYIDSNCNGVSLWKEYSIATETYNDVRSGFMEGFEKAKD